MLQAYRYSCDQVKLIILLKGDKQMTFTQSTGAILLAALVMKEISQFTFIQSLGLLLFVVLLIAIGRISYTLFTTLRDFPKEARSKVLKPRYRELIGKLDTAIANTSSADELMHALENIDYPLETLMVVVQKENSSSEDLEAARDSAIINQFKPRKKSNHINYTVWNDSGYGHINEQHFFILRHQLKKFGYDYIEINFAREVPALTFAH